MGMNQTETFFYALNQWDISTPSKKEEEFIGILNEMKSKIGGEKEELFFSTEGKEHALNSLMERVDFLTEKCKIDEDFLITGLVNLFFSLLKDTIDQRDTLKDEENLKYLSYNKISVQQWQIMQAEYFNDLNRDIWKKQRLLKTKETLNSCF